MIKLKFFASLREQLGESSLNYEPGGEKTVEQIIESLAARSQQWQILKEKDVLVAVNQSLSGKDARINDGDEVAFFPPVTGG